MWLEARKNYGAIDNDRTALVECADIVLDSAEIVGAKLVDGSFDKLGMDDRVGFDVELGGIEGCPLGPLKVDGCDVGWLLGCLDGCKEG